MASLPGSPGWIGQERATVISGEENVRNAQLITIRSALRLEMRGLRRSGRSAQKIANEKMGTDYRNKRATYVAFDKFVTERTGVARPLKDGE